MTSPSAQQPPPEQEYRPHCRDGPQAAMRCATRHHVRHTPNRANKPMAEHADADAHSARYTDHSDLRAPRAVAGTQLTNAPAAVGHGRRCIRLLLAGVFDLLASLLEVAFHLFGFALAF
jgi:hypothetical protein